MKGRKADIENIHKKVLNTLKKYPFGLTLRELGRRSGIPKSTIAYHLTRELSHYVEETVIRPKNKTIARLIKLKVK